MIQRTKTDYIIVHHSVSPKNTTVKQITQWHKARGFYTIGYHYLINDKGIHSGRDEDLVGSHCSAQGRNYDSIGICVAGNYQEDTLDSKMRENLVKLLREKLDKYGLGTDRIKGHRNYYATACPGENLYRELPAIREEVNNLNDKNMMLKRIMDQTQNKHGDSQVAIVMTPDDQGKSYLIKGGKRYFLKDRNKLVEALIALHAIGITKEDLSKIDDGGEL